MPATTEQLAQLTAVNNRINANPYVADNARFGELPDTWKVKPDGKGFLCRDYSGAKEAELETEGWPYETLTLDLCYDELGDYHCVLSADAGGETWVLDNRVDRIYRWDEPPYPYRWALRQVAGTDGFLDIGAA